MNPFLRGYLLLFERREPPAYSAATGLGLLLVFICLEYVVGPRAHILHLRGVTPPPTWARVIAMSALAILLAAAVRATPAMIGLPRWSEWTPSETLYLAQAVMIAGFIFIALNLRPLQEQTLQGLQVVAIAVATEIIWGFYQELVYRGILQSELVRRFGVIAGVVVANIAFTFGPLHFYEFSGSSSPETLAIFFAATFATGLIFGYIVYRTRNVVLVGILHGIGDAIANVPHLLH